MKICQFNTKGRQFLNYKDGRNKKTILNYKFTLNHWNQEIPLENKGY